MSDHYFKLGNTKGIVSLSNIYKYENFIFEFHSYCGPTKLKKDWEPAKLQGRKFYKMIDKWVNLTKKQKEKTRIYG